MTAIHPVLPFVSPVYYLVIHALYVIRSDASVLHAQVGEVSRVDLQGHADDRARDGKAAESKTSGWHMVSDYHHRQEQCTACVMLSI